MPHLSIQDRNGVIGHHQADVSVSPRARGLCFDPPKTFFLNSLEYITYTYDYDRGQDM